MAYVQSGRFVRNSLEVLFERYCVPYPERALAREIALGTVERLLTLNHFLGPFLSRPIQKLDVPVRVLLQMSAYQLLYLDRIPSYAILNESVRLASRYCARAKGFVNGVLRSLDNNRESLSLPQGNGAAEMAIRYSISPELIQFLLDGYGNLAYKMFEAVNLRPELHLFINLARTDAEKVSAFSDAKPTCTPHVVAVPDGEVPILPGFSEGLFFVMNRSAAFSVIAAKPQPEEVILDLCAAPGGKSFAAASLMLDRGKILSFDLAKKKVETLRQGCKRLGFNSIEARVGDATVLNRELIALADLVICDVPCSGLGIMAKQPEVRYKVSSSFDSLPSIQLSILNNAATYMRDGGRILYSTCTLNRSENEQVVERFLEAHPSFVSDDLSQEARLCGLEFLGHDCGITLLPDRTQDGFFVSVLREKALLVNYADPEPC